MGRRLLAQLLLLVKKNFILQLRRPVGALMELLLPCLFLGLVSLTRYATPIQHHCFSYFDPFSMDAYEKTASSKLNGTIKIIAMAPNDEIVRQIAAEMAASQDYLKGFTVQTFTEDQIKKLIIMADTIFNSTKLAGQKGSSSSGASLIKLPMFTIAVMPSIEVMNSALEQKPEFFSAGIQFTNLTNTNIAYKIRMASSIARRNRWYTERAYPYYFKPGPGTFKGYNKGWIALQQVIDRSILLVKGIAKADIPVVNLRQMPYPIWTEDGFANAIRNSLPLMLVISFLWISASISKELVGEKASRMKETMKMMGLSNWVLWLSWIIQRLVLMFFAVFLMVLVLKGANYLERTDPVLLFLFLFEYALSVMCFCFFLSTLFSKTTTAIAGTMLGYFILYVPYFFLGDSFDTLSDSQRYLGCLLSSTCMGFGANIISKWETMQEGLQFSNVATQPSDLDTFKMSDVILMLLVDIVIYSIMTWYVEAVFPGEFGVKQKPWFFLTRKYWCGSKLQRNKQINDTGFLNPNYPQEKDIAMEEVEGVEEVEQEGAHEKGPKDKAVGIAIRNLLKRFKTPKGKITAVNGLTLDMFEDQITSLLGHNGAGKTTTMSMLTGLYSPSGGDALINGYSILENLEGVRDSLGICPQHNVLYDRLTVMEHLDFFIRLKGYTGDVKAESLKMVEMLKLSDKKTNKADQLSGGMKRKLSVGIALAGGSRVVILDEPTAGMDPYARHATWDLLLENKKGRTILLTTHYMDEADFLGDRVAIMATGKLVCSGSSLFLKKKYGVGYHMTLVKAPSCDVVAVDNFIRGYVGTAKKISDVGSELVYVMPDDEVEHFVPLFKQLEEEKERGEKGSNIETFGLSLTTLEEVFMKVGEAAEDENMEKMAERQEDKDKDTGQGSGTKFKVFKQNELNSGAELLIQQLFAMIVKRFINTRRYYKGIIAQLVLPILFTFLGLLVVLTTEGSEGSEVARTINLKNYPSKGQKGNMYLSDFTGGDYFNDALEEYLGTLNLNLPAEDLSTKTDVLEKFYKSDDSSDCCNETALQLNSVCAAKGNERTKWASCSGKSTWGYDACFAECFDPVSQDATQSCSSAHPTPDPKYIEDKLSFFANAFLQENDDDPRFYRQHQLAFTYSTVPRFVDLIYSENGTSFGYTERDNVGSTEFSLPTLNLERDSLQNVLTAWFSHEGLHLAPGAQNALSNMILMKNDIATKISVTNHPLPSTLVDRFRLASVNAGGASLSTLMLMGFSFLTASFVLFVVEERENKSKHLQQISGVNGVVYWCGTFIWDMINYTVCILIVTILFAIFDLDGYNGSSLLAVLLTMLVYGYASIPFVYMLSHLFSSPVSAFSIIATITFISGLAGFIANLVLTILNDDFQETLDAILLILPNYGFIGAITSIYAISIQNNIYELCLELQDESICAGFKPANVYALENGSIGRQLLAMFAVGTVSFAITLLHEVFGKTIFLYLDKKRSAWREVATPRGEDEDVKRERTRVGCEIQTLSADSAVLVQNIRKEYGSKVAVQNLTLGIPKNECFGLLGVNGAGKTTTFSMLTGDISMSHGEAYVAGYNLQTNLRKIQQRIGYCPQFDALIGIMTGRELLRMFAHMRGIPRAHIEQTVNEAITNLNLDVHADKLCGTYSGGNKRKLSTAIALVGNPEVLFLDEPTAGMDPTARRFLWTVLSDLTSCNIGTSIVLTSHSMEECEALCNRLVIMVNGAFRCLGSIQHLKNKYGKGYTITLIMEEEKQNECKEFIVDTFPGVVCKEQHQGYLHYQLGQEIKWSTIFQEMEANKERLGVEDYAVNQTSLEQVFLNFAKDQVEEGPAPESRCCGCLPCCKKKANEVTYDGRRGSVVSFNKASLRARPSKASLRARPSNPASNPAAYRQV